MNHEMQSQTGQTVSRQIPLVVDLDGTLTRSDTLHESLLKLAKSNPIKIFLLPFWLMHGKAEFKKRISACVIPDVSVLPYDQAVLEKIRQARSNGRRLVLATAADEQVANAVANHLGLFDEVMASSMGQNLSGAAKRQALSEKFGAKKFDYIANSEKDQPVWEDSRCAILSGVSPSLADKMKSRHDDVEVLSTRPIQLMPLLKAARIYQWVKNTLIFVPLVAAHQIDFPSIADATIAFFSFNAAASSVYLINDLLDLEVDRRHPTKKLRPYAVGQLPIALGLVVAILLIIISIVLSLILSLKVALLIIIYLFISTSYSLVVKMYPIIDVLVLAGLYTLRLLVGGAATDITLSLWLLGFSLFLFSSLAFAKRYSEVADLPTRSMTIAEGRGYHVEDLQVLSGLGISSGIASVLMLALYVNFSLEANLYRQSEILWTLCPVLFYWICRIWLAAHRKILNDDPIIFAFKDRSSMIVAVLFGFLFVLAI